MIYINPKKEAKRVVIMSVLILLLSYLFSSQESMPLVKESVRLSSELLNQVIYSFE